MNTNIEPTAKPPSSGSLTVRVFGYSGLTQTHVSHQHSYSGDSVWLPDEPPVWSEMVSANGATPVSVVAKLPPGTIEDSARVIGIEVPDGFAIRYEYQPLGPLATNARVAGEPSRSMGGFTLLPWSKGAALSFVDASAFP